MATAVASLLIIRDETFLNEVHVSSASFNTVFFNPASLIQCIESFCFSVSHKWHWHRCVKQLCFSTIDAWKPWKKCAPHYPHSGYLVNNMGGNSHHGLLLGFCFNFVLYVEQDITESMFRVSQATTASLALPWFLLALSSEQSTEHSEHMFDQKGEVKQKSCCC